MSSARARGALIAGLLLLGAGSAAAQTPYQAAPPPEPGLGLCPGGLCQAEALASFFEALAATEAGTRDQPVHVLQVGDSHTAGDRITGKLRVELQRRFGRAGAHEVRRGRNLLAHTPTMRIAAPIVMRSATRL